MVEIVKVEDVHRGWTRFSIYTFRLDDGSELRRELEDHGRAAAVLPYDPDRRVAMLVRQFRAGMFLAGEPPAFEPPAGIIDPGEDAAGSARREALEEVGLRLTELEALGAYWSSPGSSTERTDLFLAPYSAPDQITAGGGVDDHENIEVVEVPLAELGAQADRGGIKDLKLMVMVLSLMRRKPELFA